MTTIQDTINGILIQAGGNFLSNFLLFVLLIWFIIILYFAGKRIANSIEKTGNKIMKNIPEWLNRYENILREKNAVERARAGFGRHD